MARVRETRSRMMLSTTGKTPIRILDGEEPGAERTIRVVKEFKGFKMISAGDDGEVPAILVGNEIYYFDGESVHIEIVK